MPVETVQVLLVSVQYFVQLTPEVASAGVRVIVWFVATHVSLFVKLSVVVGAVVSNTKFPILVQLEVSVPSLF